MNSVCPSTAPSLLGPAVVAAVISGLIAVVGFAVTTWNAGRLHREKLDFDRDQAERRATAEIALADRKVSADIALAEKKLALDRALAAWKRRTEFAEDLLADFYQARDIFRAARSPGGFGDEGNTRQTEDWETESDTRSLNSYYRTAERLLAKTEFFSGLASRGYRFTALFGSEATKPFEEIFQIRGEIFLAVRSLISTYRVRTDRSSLRERQRWETTIGWPHSEVDPIAARVDSAIDAVEKICGPAIQDIAP